MTNYPVPYTGGYYSGAAPQVYLQAQNQVQPCSHGLIWVDGEVGAKAYQLPQGIPANQPVALWDTNDTVIYLKSMNAMGMPNPLQKAHYTLEEHRGTGPATSSAAPVPDMSEYVRKEDMERMKKELLDTINGLSISGKAKERGADS